MENLINGLDHLDLFTRRTSLISVSCLAGSSLSSEHSSLLASQVRRRLFVEKDLDCLIILIRICSQLPFEYSITTDLLRMLSKLTTILTNYDDASSDSNSKTESLFRLHHTFPVLAALFSFFLQLFRRRPSFSSDFPVITQLKDIFRIGCTLPFSSLRRDSAILLQQLLAVTDSPSLNGSVLEKDLLVLIPLLSDSEACVRLAALCSIQQLVSTSQSLATISIGISPVLSAAFSRTSDLDHQVRQHALRLLTCLVSVPESNLSQLASTCPTLSEEVFLRACEMSRDPIPAVRAEACLSLASTAELLLFRFLRVTTSVHSTSSTIQQWSLPTLAAHLLQACSNHPLPHQAFQVPNLLSVVVLAEHEILPGSTQASALLSVYPHQGRAGALVSAADDEFPSVRLAAMDAIAHICRALSAHYLFNLHSNPSFLHSASSSSIQSSSSLVNASSPSFRAASNTTSVHSDVLAAWQQFGLSSGWCLLPCPGMSLQQQLSTLSALRADDRSDSTIAAADSASSASASASYRHYAGPALVRQQRRRLTSAAQTWSSLQRVASQMAGLSPQQPATTDQSEGEDSNLTDTADDSADWAELEMVATAAPLELSAPSRKRRIHEVDSVPIASISSLPELPTSAISDSSVPTPWLTPAHVLLPRLLAHASMLWFDEDQAVREKALSVWLAIDMPIVVTSQQLERNLAPLLLEANDTIVTLALRVASRIICVDGAATLALLESLFQLSSHYTSAFLGVANAQGSFAGKILSEKELLRLWHASDRLSNAQSEKQAIRRAFFSQAKPSLAVE